MTPQRQLVLDAVIRLGHATPEAVCAEVARADPGVNPSTVYRTLELFERLGVIRHTHLGPGAATYHRGDESAHLHLVCESCGAVTEADVALADELVGRLRESTGSHLTWNTWRSPDLRGLRARRPPHAAYGHAARRPPAPDDARRRAVPVEAGPDAGAPWHYGDPLRRAARARRPVTAARRPVAPSGRAGGGADRLTWLHSLTTQHLDRARRRGRGRRR